VHEFNKDAVRGCFRGVGALTRYEIAQAIATQLDAFKHRLPPVPLPWKNENSRLALFDAAALAMTFYSIASAPAV
jgi:hypothetical protein